MAGALLALLWAFGAAAVLGWIASAPAWHPRHGVAAACVLAAAAVAGAGWCRMPTGMLEWTGEGWRWTAAGEAAEGTAELALDLQSHLLLRWRGEAGAGAWLWLERKRAAPHWDALRRAVYSRAGTEAPHGVL